MLNYKQLVARFLNIPSYRIKSIDSSPDGKIHCQLTDSDVSHCPYCFKRNIYSKGYYSKFYTIPLQHHQQLQFNIKIKRYKCLICSKSFSDSIHLTPKHSHLSYATIEGIMSDLKKKNETFTSIARNFNISETTVKRYFDKYYTPPKVTLPHVLCFDEVFIPSLNIKSKYVTVMYDFKNKKLVDLLMSKWKNNLGNYFSKIPKS